MVKTSPFPDGHYFKFDLASPIAEMNGHRYYTACRFEQNDMPGAEYLLVECRGVSADDPQFKRWYKRFAEERLPDALLRPVCVIALRPDCAGWIARTPVPPRRLRPADHAAGWAHEAVFAELFAFGCMTAEQHNFAPAGILLDETCGIALADTSPAAGGARTGTELLHTAAESRRCTLAQALRAPSPAEAWKRLCAINDSDPALQSVPPGCLPDAIRLRLTLRIPRRKAPQRAVYSLHAPDRCVRLNDLFPELPPAPLLSMERSDAGALLLRNRSSAAWTLSRGSLSVRPGAAVRPRTGEFISIALPLGHRLYIHIDGYDAIREFTPPANESQPSSGDPAPAQDAVSDASGATHHMPDDSACAAPPDSSAEPPSDTSVQAGDPVLMQLERGQLFGAAEQMLRMIDRQIQSGDFVWAESRMRIDPSSFAAVILPAEAGTACTLGYAAPESIGSPAFDSAAHAYAAAVWLYRLLVGGYPMEGRRTRAILQDSCRSEAELAEQLYGRDALFVFDAQDPSNSIEGLPGVFADQLQRWNALPAELQEGFLHTFSACLHTAQQDRLTPAGWADLLHRLAQPAAQ